MSCLKNNIHILTLKKNIKIIASDASSLKKQLFFQVTSSMFFILTMANDPVFSRKTIYTFVLYRLLTYEKNVIK